MRSDFENDMRMENFDFSINVVTQTWLNDITCDLYSLDGYALIEKEKNNMRWSLGFFLKNVVKYKSCADFKHI